MNSIFTSQAGWHWAFTIVLGVVLFVLLINLGLWFLARRQAGGHPRRRLYRRVGKWGSLVMLTALALLGFRYERATYLSSPLVEIGWLLLLGWWGWESLRYRLRVYPEELRAYREQERRGQWLPSARKSRRRRR